MIILDGQLNGKRRWRAHAESVADVQHWLRYTPKTWTSDMASRDGSVYNDHSWTLGHGYAKVQELARDGWHEGAMDLHGRLQATLPAPDRMASWRYDVAGERPDIGRYLSGEPDNMMRHGHPKGHRPIITIFVNVWIRCDVKAQSMANYGAAMVNVIDQLEQSGRRVELMAGTVAPHFRDRNIILSATWTVKKAEDPVDLAALAFSLAHPGASRRFGWAVWERSATKTDGGYGAGVGYVATLDDLADASSDTLILNGLNSDPYRCTTLDDAIKFVREQINAAAGEELVTLEG